MSRQRQRRSILPYLFLALGLLLICIALVGGFWLFREVPRRAEKDFGPPSSSLSRMDRIVYSARLLLNRDKLLQPLDSRGEPRDFEISMGENVPVIATRLVDEGILRDAETFRQYLIYAGLDTGVQAGNYRLSPALNAVQLARALQDATPTEVSFSILPGWRAEEIADALPTSGLSVTADEFLALVNDPSELQLPEGWPELSSLEGFLYPDVYRLKRDISAGVLVEIFVSRFDEQVDADLRAALERQGYDLSEAVTLASLVQREAVVSEEQPMIASVFLNRMEAAIKLDSDPTVQYALGYNEDQKTWWTNPLSLDDLQYDSPYNTYIYPGLPPGPISNPALNAIQAVAYPASTPYYFFRARCDNSGRHFFAKTYEEHLQNACP